MKIYKTSQFNKLINKITPENNNLQIPKILFHATYQPLLESIMKNGLGNNVNRINYEDSVKGVVYLSDNKDVAESYAETSDIVPESWLDKIIILQINTDGLNPLAFYIDQNNLQGDTLEFHGTVPPSNIDIL